MDRHSDVMDALQELRTRFDNLSEPPANDPPERDSKTHTPDPTDADAEPDERLLARAEIRHRLGKLSVNQLFDAFVVQAAYGARQGAGVGIDRYMAHLPDAGARWIRQKAPWMAEKVLDVPGAAALIRQDLEPILHEIFVKVFPAYDMIPKKPSNGLVHAWDRVVSFGSAGTLSELGTVSDDTSVYEQATTPIAIVATRRGISLKAQAAVAAGGMPYAPDQTEVRNGVTAVVAKLQNLTLHGNASVAGKGATDEEGAYDANGFDGIRGAVDSGNRNNLGTLSIAEGLDLMAQQMLDQGAVPPYRVFIDPKEMNSLAAEVYPERRWDPNATEEIRTGVRVRTHVSGVAGDIPLLVVPGGYVGTYTSGGTVRDITMFKDGNLAYPWLFSDGPSVLEIPVGVSGQLTRLYIIFCMHGLEVTSKKWLAKVRVTQ